VMGQGSAKEQPEDQMALPPTRAFFAASKRFAVVGASADRAKFGNKILRAYQGAGLVVTVRVPRKASKGWLFLT
jgi:hypothetical protein